MKKKTNKIKTCGSGEKHTMCSWKNPAMCSWEKPAMCFRCHAHFFVYTPVSGYTLLVPMSLLV